MEDFHDHTVMVWTAPLSPPKASQVVLVVQNLPANAGDLREEGSIPGSERSQVRELRSHMPPSQKPKHKTETEL